MLLSVLRKPGGTGTIFASSIAIKNVDSLSNQITESADT